MKVYFKTYRNRASKTRRRLAGSSFLFALLGLVVGGFLASLSSLPAQAAVPAPPGLVLTRQVLAQGNLLPLPDLLKQGLLVQSKEDNWFLSITSIPTPQNLQDDVSLSVTSATSQRYDGDPFSFRLFQEDEKEYVVSSGLLHFLHTKEDAEPREFATSYQTTSIKRHGVEIGFKTPLFLGLRGDIALRYWEITNYNHTWFDGRGTVLGEQTNLTGTLAHWSHSLEAFRKEPYSGHGLALLAGLQKELSSNTTLFIQDISLFTKAVLYNVGVLQGVLESDREYLDLDDFLNYGALIKGRYEYQNLGLPVRDQSVFGIEHRIGDRARIQLSADRELRPRLQISLAVKDWEMTARYLYPSLYYVEAAHSMFSVGAYLGGTMETGLTSLGLDVRGCFRF